MHELSIAKNLSDIILEVAGEEKLSKVTRVSVCFGELVQVVPAIFETAFNVTVEDTIIKDAELDIEVVTVKLKCRNCGKEFSAGNDLFFQCSNCDSFDAEIINGKELFLKSIEGE